MMRTTAYYPRTQTALPNLRFCKRRGIGVSLLSLLCKEDKQEAADKMNKAFKDFKDALLQKLNLHEDQDLAPVKIIREEPSEGYKDFNDELLDKKQFSMTDVVETAFDENGVDLTFERQEENEETKHHGFKR